MKEYNLVDIHFHTEDSYDTVSEKYEWNRVSNYLDDKIDLLVKTDHNLIGFENYLKQLKSFESISYLPGVELNIATGSNKVHWLFIFNPSELLKKDESGKEIGYKLEEKFNEILYGKKVVGESEARDFKAVEAKKIIDLIISLDIDVIAIPHLFKHAGYKPSPKRKDINELNNLIYENIILGFESKEYSAAYENKIKLTAEHIATQTEQEEIDRRQEALEYYEELQTQKEDLEYSIIYGSDLHLVNCSEKNGKCASIDEYQNLLENLFYIRAEATFEGLKMSLSDPQSRVKKYSELEKVKKISSNIIESIQLDINGKSTTLKLGSNLNSIIGLKGSGKSFILNSIANSAGNYNEGKISEIQNFKIKFSDDKKWYLPSEVSERFDIIRQKNSNVESQKSIYEILTDAPHDQSKFLEVLEQYAESENIKSLEPLHAKLNKLLNKYNDLNDILECILMSSEHIKLLNEENKSIEVRGRNLFKGNNEILEKALSKYEKRKENFEGIINFLEEEDFELSSNEMNELSKESLAIYKKFSHEKLISLYTEVNSNNKEHITLGNELLSFSKKIYSNINEQTTIISQSINEEKSEIKARIKKMYKLLYKIEQDKLELKKYETKFVSKVYKIEDNFTIKYIINVDIMNKENIFKNFNASIEQEFDTWDNGILDLLNYSDEKLRNIAKLKHARRKEYFDELETTPELEIIKDKVENKVMKMSAGERTELVLDVFLEQGKYRPLLLDQPEDDLDNSTVYYYLVEKIRKLKFKRQIIIVSHNANLVLNSDSDYIIYCSRDEEGFSFVSEKLESQNDVDFTSLNGVKTKAKILGVCSSILEGGVKALEKRVKKIGYKSIYIKNNEENRCR